MHMRRYRDVFMQIKLKVDGKKEEETGAVGI